MYESSYSEESARRALSDTVRDLRDMKEEKSAGPPSGHVPSRS